MNFVILLCCDFEADEWALPKPKPNSPLQKNAGAMPSEVGVSLLALPYFDFQRGARLVDFEAAEEFQDVASPVAAKKDVLANVVHDLPVSLLVSLVVARPENLDRLTKEGAVANLPEASPDELAGKILSLTASEARAGYGHAVILSLMAVEMA